MEAVDNGVKKLVGKLRDFVSFFTLENAEMLNAWGTNDLNLMHFTVRKYSLAAGLPTMVITYEWRKHIFTVGRQLHTFMSHLADSAQERGPGAAAAEPRAIERQ